MRILITAILIASASACFGQNFIEVRTIDQYGDTLSQRVSFEVAELFKVCDLQEVSNIEFYDLLKVSEYERRLKISWQENQRQLMSVKTDPVCSESKGIYID